VAAEQMQTQLIVGGIALALFLVTFLAVLRTSISTRRTALALERTNELLEKIWKNSIPK
jgi:hypothetical protein